jgi:hypothetical protein
LHFTSRRRFLIHAAGISAAGWAALGKSHLALAADTAEEVLLRTLARVCRLMFPHDALADHVYTGIAGELLLDDSLGPMIRTGLRDLSGFLAMSELQQLQSLSALETAPFFTDLQNDLRVALYSHPTVWELIGYPGPSLPTGYVNGGFNDIDWLPGS